MDIQDLNVIYDFGFQPRCFDYTKEINEDTPLYNFVLTQSTKIIDVSGDKEIHYKSEIPARSVVIPGSFKKDFPSGTFYVPCALIIGKRKDSTDKKTTLNQALREFGIST